MLQKFGHHFKAHFSPTRAVPKNEPDFIDPKNNLHTEKKPRPFDAKLQANKFSENPIIMELALAQQELEEKKELRLIKAIFKSGNLDNIISFLQTKEVSPVFEKEICRIKKTYGQELHQATFLNEKDWKILAGIELCDKRTFEHSIGTYLIAKEKIEKELTDLSLRITDEGVALEQLYRACLFHDIGKIAIPDFILNNPATDSQWVYLFMELPKNMDSTEDSHVETLNQDDILVEILDKRGIATPDHIRDNLEEMTKFFEENEIRLAKFMPIKTVLGDEQKAKLTQIGLDPEKTFGEIMDTHEKSSRRILQELGYIIEALLAGNHHSCKYQNNERPTSGNLLNSHIIRLSDIQNALNSERSYRHKETHELSILASLVKETKNIENDPILKTLTARWVNTDLKKINPDSLQEIRQIKPHQHHSYFQELNKRLLLIEKFLIDNLPSNPAE